MTNKELQDELKKYPDDAEIWMPVFNKYVETYGVVDYVFSGTWDEYSNDFFGTPGRMDKRVFDNHRNEEGFCRGCQDTILCLDSKFGYGLNTEVDFGDDDINEDIELINGEGGDEDLVWHQNNFEWNADIECFSRQWFEDGELIYEITYHKPARSLTINNLKDKIYGGGVLKGTEDIRKMIDACKIKESLWYI